MATTAKTKSLSQSKIVIIGGSSGIGFATAKATATLGAGVIIASATQKKIDAALQHLPQNATGQVLDVTNEAQVKDFFAGIGAFDHLVYTAGENIKLGLLADSDAAESKEYFNIRYWGAMMCAKYATPYVLGSITFTSGVAANRPGPGWWLGSSICSAMEGFTRALSIELAPLRVNIVSPGVVKTPLWDSMSEADREGLYSSYADKLPVNYVADADDLAKTYIYLMQQQYATGQAVVVDGGAVLV